MGKSTLKSSKEKNNLSFVFCALRCKANVETVILKKKAIMYTFVNYLQRRTYSIGNIL